MDLNQALWKNYKYIDHNVASFSFLYVKLTPEKRDRVLSTEFPWHDPGRVLYGRYPRIIFKSSLAMP
jgi:hypothetical protein